MALSVVSTSSSQSCSRRPPDVGALVADLRRQHGSAARAAERLFELLQEDDDLVRAVAFFVIGKVTAPAALAGAPGRRRARGQSTVRKRPCRSRSSSGECRRRSWTSSCRTVKSFDSAAAQNAQRGARG